MLLNAYCMIRPLLVTCYNKTKIPALAVCCLLLVACGNGTDDNSNTPSIETPSAKLSIEKTEFGGRFKLHGSESTIPTGYQVNQVTYTITDADTGEMVAQKQDTDHTEPHFQYLSPGSYNVKITLDVTNSNATNDATTYTAASYQEANVSATSASSDTVSLSTDETIVELELDDDDNCWLKCSTYDDDDTKVGCTFDFDTSSCSDIYTLSLADLLSTAQYQNSDVDEDDALCIRAFGAAGKDGSDYDFIWTNSGGDGGDGGVAQTITTYSELSSQYTDLYYILGYDGSSTVVTGVDFSSDTDIDVDGVIVSAGGGGGGGEASIFGTGGDGGDGAMVDSSAESLCAFGVGDDGDTGIDEGGAGGGTSDQVDCSGDMTNYVSDLALGGLGYSSGYDGSDGLGGLSYSSSWFNASDFSDDYAGDGNGGENKVWGISTSGGNGAGGVGGGEGGYGGGGGGGAGSFATGATVTSDWANDDYYTTNSSTYGNVTFIFSTED